ncbi:TATA box-binding protein-associated factor RNA polymerase I subunit B [Brachyhypopomus gauderio]|uniref:TATA box-binding protein-associated factor RNA polymerase I subunit B n=1 Tax=Brachyhypopomus gauderio TaxID=698409 RepID=UPI0040435D1A
MDEEFTDGYSEPCGQCGSVCWGITDTDQFFCKNCHNVIEKTKEVVDSSAYTVNNRITKVPSSRKRNGREGGREWMVCEGFQVVLKCQAEALIGLGVRPEFKNHVLWNFWMRYLQKTRQAYTQNPVNINRDPGDLPSNSDLESLAPKESTDDSIPSRPSSVVEGSGYSSDARLSVCSGSLDAEYYSAKERKGCHLMTMPRTLAMCHIALIWLQEAITLSDLLRLVSQRHVPYVNVHEHFPEQMRFFGKDGKLFRVESIPSYSEVHREALQLAKVMELPAFPPVTRDCILHPALLCSRYMIDANLPNDLHMLVREVIKRTAMGKDLFLTFNPTGSNPKLPYYDIQAAAILIVTLKLLFKLDDQTEWMLSRNADEKDQAKKKTTAGGKISKMFSLRRWYMSVQSALERVREVERRALTRQVWKPKKAVLPLKQKSLVLKRRRLAEQLQDSFQTFTDSPPQQQPPPPSSFLFLWGAGDGADGPSLHHKRLDFLLRKKDGARRLVNRKYWHPALRVCHPRQCRDHFSEMEPSLPRMYVWMLELFSFLLGVRQAQVHREVVEVERRLLSRPLPRADAHEPRRKRRKASPQ